MMSQFGVQFHTKSNTKSNGNGKKNLKFRDRRKHEVGSYFTATRAADKNVSVGTRKRGGNSGVRFKQAGTVNLLTKSGYKPAKITGVIESRDNRNFARQAIITKGTVIGTDQGNAVVLNRPGREGSINARLL